MPSHRLQTCTVDLFHPRPMITPQTSSQLATHDSQEPTFYDVGFISFPIYSSFLKPFTGDEPTIRINLPPPPTPTLRRVHCPKHCNRHHRSSVYTRSFQHPRAPLFPRATKHSHNTAVARRCWQHIHPPKVRFSGGLLPPLSVPPASRTWSWPIQPPRQRTN